MLSKLSRSDFQLLIDR